MKFSENRVKFWLSESEEKSMFIGWMNNSKGQLCFVNFGGSDKKVPNVSGNSKVLN
jgi:hypothetical protein